MVTGSVLPYKLLFIGWFFIIILDSCSKSSENQPNDIPVTPVNFSIDVTSTTYSELNTVSGSIYLTGGYRGILVYRISTTDFVAFERACPYDWQKTDARIVRTASGLILDCPSCKSQFSILDGTPLSGPSKYPLKTFQTSFESPMLYVYN